MKLLIAIDDTDNLESVGTGRLSRMLSDYLFERGLVGPSTVTRHQFLVHPDIPYTSHNSSACIEAEKKGRIEDVIGAAKDFLVQNFHEGANPGLCVVHREEVPQELSSFGRRAQEEVLKIQDARDLAQRLGVFAWWHGDTGQGCIGAMAGVGLRGTGNDGRFIGLEGIRDIKGTMSVGEILGTTPIRSVMSGSGEMLGALEEIDTLDWVRPELSEGFPVLKVFREKGKWVPEGKKKPRQQKK
jgi:tRNA(Ile2) C34 agmatinyltransferase TiaS